MRISRLRAGEWLTAMSVVVMAVALFVLDWHGAEGRPRRVVTYPPVRRPAASTGWQSSTEVRWLLLVAIIMGASLVVAQAACRAPAIPSTLDVISIVVALLAVLALIDKVVVNPGERQQFGAWVELIGALGLLAGSFLATRQEGILEADGPGEIPVVHLGAQGPGRET